MSVINGKVLCGYVFLDCTWAFKRFALAGVFTLSYWQFMIRKFEILFDLILVFASVKKILLDLQELFVKLKTFIQMLDLSSAKQNNRLFFQNT